MAFFIMAVSGFDSVRRQALISQGLFRALPTSHLLIHPVPNTASFRANPESRGGKVEGVEK